MARDYRPVDRDQPFLLPPDMRDWLAEDHLAWFVLEVIEQLDTGRLHAQSKRGGAGRQAFDPDLLLGLWIYASARGISSSRQIERACSEDVAFRVLCGQDVPDHTVLARFRQRHQGAMVDLFAQVLALCVAQGLGRFGVLAIDGTKIRANAAKSKTVTLQRLQHLATAELEKAAVTDAAEDAANEPGAGDDVPPGLGPGGDRAARIRAAIEELEQQIETEHQPDLDKYAAQLGAAEQRVANLQAETDRRVAAAAAAVAAGTPKTGRPPKAENDRLRSARAGLAQAQARLVGAQQRKAANLDGATVDHRSAAKRNTTDHQSRIMKSTEGFVQAYNAQLAVSDDGLVVAAQVTNSPTDIRQLQPMIAAAEQMLERCQLASDAPLRIGTVLADAGYLCDENLDAAGPPRLIAPGKGRTGADGWNGSTLHRGKTRSAKAMIEALDDPQNRALYRRRGVTVEPVNGHLKDRRGLRQFATRGLAAVNAELLMAAMTTNLLKLFTSRNTPAIA